MDAGLRLNPEIDVERHRRRFAETGRALIRDALDPAAARRILTGLEMERGWNLVTDSDGRHLDLDAASMARLAPQERARFLGLVHEQAARGFQYLYASVPIYDRYHGRAAPGNFLDRVFEFLNGEDFLTLLRAVTGRADGAFVDAQATRFDGGHFLTEHDDDQAGLNRRAAYVLGLTPQWRADWGGLTLFLDADGQVAEAFTPTFNSLALFAVPQPHAVSAVAPYAPKRRFAISGWLRAGADPLRRADRERETAPAPARERAETPAL
jgi:SM-20-related protein